ncbi:ThiF family adenylyltransferase [Ruegeria sp. 2012CJ41-6]|uniref:ThiF family adenylyltransferase n=1 Tax=Ruegeria spongiae TaxID=2942209 RepID=A0ABT0Q5U0_9RHOB|nr:HesA/MoeB/ThiF family protein [Ruegeria spongiae]MCL6285180.1 ThiF family adenylyltransferase [Ruegeria spongiae]
MSRYARQMQLPEVGTDGQALLAQARVLVVGAGGLAAPLLPLLAGAGVGHLTILDPDVVELSNLHRQTLFTEADCGQPKVMCAATRCQEINSEISATGVVQTLSPANAAAFVQQADIVLDCADSYAASYVLSDTCYDQQTPLISASALGLNGYVGGFCGTGPSLRAVFPEMPDNTQNCASSGVLGPVVAMIGALQAQMALSVLLGFDPSPIGQMVQVDAGSFHLSGFRFDNAPEPAHGYAFVAASELGPNHMIIELRDATEAPMPAHPDALRIAADKLRAALPDPATPLALCCASGLRAWRAAEQVTEFWPGEIVLVAASTS